MDAEITWFTRCYSFIQNGQKYAGSVVVSNTEIPWAEPLLAETSVQKAELVALTKALELRWGGRRVGSVAKSTVCSSTGPEFNSQ